MTPTLLPPLADITATTDALVRQYEAAARLADESARRIDEAATKAVEAFARLAQAGEIACRRVRQEGCAACLAALAGYALDLAEEVQANGRLGAPEGTAEAFRRDPEFWPDATPEQDRRRDLTVAGNKASLNGNGVGHAPIGSHPFVTQESPAEPDAPRSAEALRSAIGKRPGDETDEQINEALPPTTVALTPDASPSPLIDAALGAMGKEKAPAKGAARRKKKR